MIFAFLKGIFLGLGLVMPLGPLNLFIFNNSSLQKRFYSILPVVLVASLCDILLIFFAVIGVDVISSISWFKPVIMAIGVVFLSYMGLRMWKSTAKALEPAVVLPVRSQILYCSTLSILNPHAIFDTFVVIGAVSTTFIGHQQYAFTIGCMLSDFLWFGFLGAFGFFLRRVANGQKIFTFINKLSAIIMMYLSVQLLIELFQEF